MMPSALVVVVVVVGVGTVGIVVQRLVKQASDEANAFVVCHFMIVRERKKVGVGGKGRGGEGGREKMKEEGIKS